MPTRLLREGILTSGRVDQLDFGAEVFYRRLMSKVDDYGLYDSRPSILRASLYPLKVDRVREADISRWMAACQKAGLIVLYEAEGKSCLKMLDTNWQRRSEPKYPLPTVNSCLQLETPVHLDVVEDVVEDTTAPPTTADAVGDFEVLWQAYPKKRGKGKAQESWKRLKPSQSLLDQMLSTLRWQSATGEWQRESGRFIPNPATWLNQKRWLDEPSHLKHSAVVKGSDGKDYDLPDPSL